MNPNSPKPITYQFTSQSPEDTFSLGCSLGDHLFPGAVLALQGELGSGKTLFTKGVSKGLGVRNYQYVNSPTFVIMQEYLGRLIIHHYDTYRLDGPDDLMALGFEEDISSAKEIGVKRSDGETPSKKGIVVVVEWADRVSEVIPDEALTINFEHLNPEEIPTSEKEQSKAPLANSVALATELAEDSSSFRRLTFNGDITIWTTVLELLKI